MARYAAQNLLGNQYTRIYDRSTHETLDILGAKVKFYDDFNHTTVWSTTNEGPWLAKDTGAAGTVLEEILANQSGGVMKLELDEGQNEKEEAGLYFGDARTFNLDKGLIFEARVAVHTAPTDQAEIYFGLSGVYAEGPIAEADAGPLVHAFFCFDGALTPTIHTDDNGGADNDAVATGVTEVLDTYSIFRIEILDVTSVKFYIDGVRVGAATTFSVANGTNVLVQPFLMAHKETGAGDGVAYFDYVKVWQLSR